MSRYVRPLFQSVNCLNRGLSPYSRPLASVFRHTLNRPFVLSFSTSLPQKTSTPPKSPSTPTEAQKQMDPKLRDRIQSIIKSDTLVLFMKGTPAEPACGFSMRAARILQMHGVPFSAIDIFEEEGLRDGQ